MALTFDLILDTSRLKVDGKPLGAPVVFEARAMLEKEHRELMQAHFSLSDEEREAKQHEYNVAFLAKVAAGPPKGLPGFPEEFDDLAQAVTACLGEKTEVNEFFATQLVSEHLAAGGNRYFFR